MPHVPGGFFCGNVYNSILHVLKGALSDTSKPTPAVVPPLTDFSLLLFFSSLNMIFLSVVSFRFILFGFIELLVAVGL